MTRNEWVRDRWAEILDAAPDVQKLAQAMGISRSQAYRYADGYTKIPAWLPREYLRATQDHQGFSLLTGASDCSSMVVPAPSAESAQRNLDRAAYELRAAIAELDRCWHEALEDGEIDDAEVVEIESLIDAAQQKLESKRASARFASGAGQ